MSVSSKFGGAIALIPFALLAAAYVTDIMFEFGLYRTLPFVIVVLAGYLLNTPKAIIIFALLSGALLLVGESIAPEQGSTHGMWPLFAPTLASIAIIALLLAHAKNTSLKLKASEKKRARQANARIAQLIGDKSHEILVLDAAAKKIIRASGLVQKNLGYSQEELFDKKPIDLMRDLRQDDLTDLTAELYGGGPRNTFLNTCMVRKDGSSFLAELHIFYTPEVEPPVLVCFVGDDPNQSRTFGQIVENSANEIYMFDAETLHFVQANRGARENLGYTADELAQLTPCDIKPEFTRKEFDEMLRPLRDGSRQEIVIETVHQRKDGSVYDVELNTQIATDRKPAAFFSVVIDVTERKAAEDEIRNSEARHSAIVKTATDAIITADENGIVHMFNPAAEKMFGYIADEILGRNVDLIVPSHYHAEHTDSMARFLRTGKTSIIGKGREVEALHRDGSSFPVDLALATWELDGATMFTAAIRDMSAQRATEKALEATESGFQSLMNNSPASMVFKDTQHRFTSVGQEFLRRYGLTRGQVIGKTVTDILSADTARKSIEQERAVLETGQVVIEEYESTFVDGEAHILNMTMFPIKGPGGTIRGIASIGTDMTEQRWMEGQLRQKNKMEALGRLAGGVAHEFNNLLLPVITLTEISLEELGDAGEVTEYLETSLLAAKKGKALIARILGFSRQQLSDRQQAPLREIIAEAIKVMQATLPSQISIKSHLGTFDESVFVDPDEIHQVVLNLGANAASAIGLSSGEIEIGLRQVDASKRDSRVPAGLAAGKYAVLAVRDTGCGMDDEIMGKIFDPLFTTQPSGHGTGMGLSIVHTIVEGHEGVISVSSRPGSGTTFEICLPLDEPQVYQPGRTRDGDADPEKQSESNGSGGGRGGGYGAPRKSQ